MKIVFELKLPVPSKIYWRAYLMMIKYLVLVIVVQLDVLFNYIPSWLIQVILDFIPVIVQQLELVGILIWFMILYLMLLLR
jgi:hypothetical protein